MTQTQHGFNGSYNEADCRFLLTELHDTAGGAGNSGWEEIPTPGYFALYHGAMEVNCLRVATDVARLAVHLNATTDPEVPVVLASLARAGTPFGALLVRALRILGRQATHYGVSLIKKYGVDHAALDYIVARHPDAKLYFVDGWTGKGGISRELARSVADYNATRHTQLTDKLTVLADLAGTAGMAVSTDDYMVPSAGINAPMNGLISKTYGEHEQMPAGSFHGAYVLEHLRSWDLSNHFINSVTIAMRTALRQPLRLAVRPMVTDAVRRDAQARCTGALARVMKEIGTDNEDLVKHGYAETVRAVQRRPMKSLLLRDPSTPQNQPLIALALSLKMSIIASPTLEYECIGICS